MANGYTIKHNATKELLGTLATTTLVTSKHTRGRTVAKNLGLSKKHVYQSLQQCLLHDDGVLDFWSGLRKQQRSNGLSTETRALVIEWWNMETTMYLDQKKICKKKLGGSKL